MTGIQILPDAGGSSIMTSSRDPLEEADAMLALIARMNGPGVTTWLREVRGGNVAYDGPVPPPAHYRGSKVPASRVSPPPDPAREIEAVLRKPLGLSLAELRAAVPSLPAGACCRCRLPRGRDRGPMCAWCAELALLEAEGKTRQAARPRNRNAGGYALIAAGLALVIASALLPPAVTVAAAVLFTILVWRVKL